MVGPLIKGGYLGIEIQVKYYVKMKVEPMVMLLQAKECQRLSENHQKLEERFRIDSLFIALRRNQAY